MTEFARPFVLQRDADPTGVSGVGTVADGVQWPDGSVSVRWRGDRPSVVFWQGGLDDALSVHGHGGATRVVWSSAHLTTTGDAAEADNEQLRQRLDRVITHRDTLEAAITQVRAIKKSPGRSAFNLHANAQDDGWDQALDAVHVALDGLPTTDDAPPPASSAATPVYELREALLVLLSRAGRGVLLPEEAGLLRQHVETELRAGDKARRELATMTHVARVNGRAHRIAYQASVEAHAAVARMGQMASAWEQQLPLVIRTATVVDAVRTVTEGLLTPADALAEQRAGDLSEEHDVHRKQLAGAIDMTLDRNWEQLIAGAARLHGATSAWIADVQAATARAERAEKRVEIIERLNRNQADTIRRVRMVGPDLEHAATAPGLAEPAREAMCDASRRIRAALDGPQAPIDAPRCCVCGSPAISYRNFREQPFCWPCADCSCNQLPCIRTALDGTQASADALDGPSQTPTDGRCDGDHAAYEACPARTRTGTGTPKESTP